MNPAMKSFRASAKRRHPSAIPSDYIVTVMPTQPPIPKWLRFFRRIVGR